MSIYIFSGSYKAPSSCIVKVLYLSLFFYAGATQHLSILAVPDLKTPFNFPSYSQAKAHVRELQSTIVAATLQQLAKDAAELADDAEVSGSEDSEAAEGEVYLGCTYRCVKGTSTLLCYSAAPILLHMD